MSPEATVDGPKKSSKSMSLSPGDELTNVTSGEPEVGGGIEVAPESSGKVGQSEGVLEGTVKMGGVKPSVSTGVIGDKGRCPSSGGCDDSNCTKVNSGVATMTSQNVEHETTTG